MTEPKAPPPSDSAPPPESESSSEDIPSIPPDPALSGLLRRSMTEDDSKVDLLQSVQTKLRQRSGGKFYAEGWSLSKQPPISTYLITSLLMLALLLVLYAALFSFSGTPKTIDIEPPAIRVMPNN
jgi:hypothetical protein